MSETIIMVFKIIGVKISEEIFTAKPLASFSLELGYIINVCNDLILEIYTISVLDIISIYKMLLLILDIVLNRDQKPRKSRIYPTKFWTILMLVELDC